MKIDAKICGLTDPASLDAAIKYGASLIGLVFFPPSPRNIHIEEAAMLVRGIPEHILKVGLFVDGDDGLIDAVTAHVPLDVLQLHGEESVERCADLHERKGKAIFKAIKVQSAEDLESADRYAKICDRLLFDAKPPVRATRPGGNAETFDWTVLEGKTWPVPWLLAGGLTPDNVGMAIRRTGCPGVDTSSGVESVPGKKDPEKIRAFLKAVEQASGDLSA